MKKIIALLLVAVMSLLLVACGETKTDYSVGTMVSTDCAELTLISCDFSDTYNSIVANEGKVFAILSFSIKNTGKTEFSYIKTVDGKKDSLMFSAIPCVDYNNGYLFSYDDMLGNLKLCSTDMTLKNLEPLSDAFSVQVAIAVPAEVEENKDNPLVIKMAIPTTKGTEVFDYKIR